MKYNKIALLFPLLAGCASGAVVLYPLGPSSERVTYQVEIEFPDGTTALGEADSDLDINGADTRYDPRYAGVSQGRSDVRIYHANGVDCIPDTVVPGFTFVPSSGDYSGVEVHLPWLHMPDMPSTDLRFDGTVFVMQKFELQNPLVTTLVNQPGHLEVELTDSTLCTYQADFTQACGPQTERLSVSLRGQAVFPAIGNGIPTTGVTDATTGGGFCFDPREEL